jgi:hypothetical protein
LEVRLHPHAVDRLAGRVTTEQEVVGTVLEGEPFQARFGRSGFRRDFPFRGTWRGRYYETTQIEAYAVREGDGWLVLSLITKYF